MTSQEAADLALKHARQAEAANTSLLRGTWGQEVKPEIYRDLMRESALASMWANVSRCL
jgi:hypothetical protein